MNTLDKKINSLVLAAPTSEINRLKKIAESSTQRADALKRQIHQDAVSSTKKSFGASKPPEDEERRKRWQEHFDHHVGLHPALHEHSLLEKQAARDRLALKKALRS
jgi:hypothetical protein